MIKKPIVIVRMQMNSVQDPHKICICTNCLCLLFIIFQWRAKIINCLLKAAVRLKMEISTEKKEDLYQIRRTFNHFYMIFEKKKKRSIDATPCIKLYVKLFIIIAHNKKYKSKEHQQKREHILNYKQHRDCVSFFADDPISF